MDIKEYRNLLEEIDYLPSYEELIQQCKMGLFDILCGGKKEGIEYEIVTKELVDGLTHHLINFAQGKKTTILELGAGNGKLAYNMRKALHNKVGDQIEYYAIDNKSEKRKDTPTIVEDMSFETGIDKYNPNIIIHSWLRPHPENLLPNKFQEELDKLEDKGNKTQEEEILLRELYLKLYNTNTGPDITHYRRQREKLKEYILIGPANMTGDREKTYGYVSRLKIPGGTKEYTLKDIETKFLSKEPPFEKDGFSKKILEIPTVNKFFGSKFTDARSQIFSFTRE